MNKPNPIKEIIVERISPTVGFCVITVANDDSASWIDTVAPEFGTLTVCENKRMRHMMILKTYNYNEVCDYLESGE